MISPPPLSEEIRDALEHLARDGRIYICRCPEKAYDKRQWARQEWERAVEEARIRLEVLAGELERVLDPPTWSARRSQ